MKNKIYYIVGILVLLLFTGCTPEYNLEINNGMINEELKISGYDEEQKEIFFLPQYASTDHTKDYKQKESTDSVSYSYRFSFKNFLNSNMAKSCYDALLLYKEDDHYVLHTGSEFECMPYQVSDTTFLEYDNINISIKFVDYDVLENNADSVNGNVYTWTINKDNNNDKTILVKFKSNKTNTENQEKSNKFDLNPMYIAIAIGILAILVLFILLYVSMVNKKRNKI